MGLVKVELFRCDQCGKESKRYIDLSCAPKDAHTGWIHVTVRTSTASTSIEAYLCCYKCLCRWVERMKGL